MLSYLSYFSHLFFTVLFSPVQFGYVVCACPVFVPSTLVMRFVCVFVSLFLITYVAGKVYLDDEESSMALGVALLT